MNNAVMNANNMAVRIMFIRKSPFKGGNGLSSPSNFYNLVIRKGFSISRHKGLRTMQNPDNDNNGDTVRKLSPAAQRALKEAEERRRQAKAMELPPEIGGREGPEAVRFGDYEIKGRAIDF
ncbi:hypothetical protein J2Z84_002916 [Agrobacterium rubi]|nr:hypothetical protein [Agrobacterium rubi]